MQKGALKKRKQIGKLLLFILAILAINILFSKVNFRIDLTNDNRYTLSQPTKKILKNLDRDIHIKVFLKAENLPASFRHFAISTKNLLNELSRYSDGHLHFEFVNPLSNLSVKEKAKVMDSLAQLGIYPFNIKAQSDATNGVTTQLIFPAALINYKGQKIGISLLQQQPGSHPEQSLNYSTSLLEYKFMHAISRLNRERPPKIAYILGNGEILAPSVYDLLSILDHNYRWDTLNLKTAPFIPKSYDAIIILDPIHPFTQKEKIKIDQYVMQGGKILWAIHSTQASMDSLQTQTSFLAYDHRLNLKNLLFTYGVRVNPDILQDLQCFSIPITIGHIGNRPQIKRIPWIYAPLLHPASGHPITNNLNLVLSSFPGSIDTTKIKSIKKTVLLSTSSHSRSIATPVRISMADVKTKPNPRAFQEKYIPVAVLLEGKFTSAFKNRLSQKELKDIALKSGKQFQATSYPTKMIVVSDPNIFENKVSKKDGSLPMGMDRYTRQLFANRTFFKNCLTYLTDTTGIMLARNKEFTLRLLDKAKVAHKRGFWTVLNFAVPFLFVLLFGIVFQFIRKRKFVE